MIVQICPMCGRVRLHKRPIEIVHEGREELWAEPVDRDARMKNFKNILVSQTFCPSCAVVRKGELLMAEEEEMRRKNG